VVDAECIINGVTQGLNEIQNSDLAPLDRSDLLELEGYFGTLMYVLPNLMELEQDRPDKPQAQHTHKVTVVRAV